MLYTTSEDMDAVNNELAAVDGGSSVVLKLEVDEDYKINYDNHDTSRTVKVEEYDRIDVKTEITELEIEDAVKKEPKGEDEENKPKLQSGEPNKCTMCDETVYERLHKQKDVSANASKYCRQYEFVDCAPSDDKKPFACGRCSGSALLNCTAHPDEKPKPNSDKRETHCDRSPEHGGRPKRFACCKCDFSTAYKRVLKVHVQAKHEKRVFACGQCDYATGYKNNLNKHVQVKHGGMLFRCEQCDYSAGYKGNLNKHVQVKHDTKLFECDRCAYSTAYKGDLRKHALVKHDNAFSFGCSQCGYSTGYKKNLKRHIQVKHRKEVSFECKQCNYFTRYKNALKEHTQVKHVNEKAFKCNRCSYTAGYRRNLKRHVQLKHDNEKTFEYKIT